MSKTLLYIEDDLIDIEHMKWICRKIPSVTPFILERTSSVKEFLEKNKVDIIITDQYIGNIHFSAILPYLCQQEYYLLSNEKRISQSVEYPPKSILLKPLTLEKLENLIK